MVLPALVVTGAAKLIASEAVQAAAAQAAQKLAKNVYGRVMGARASQEAPAEAVTDLPLHALIADLPTRDEMAASFALLQTELDERHKRANIMLVAVLVLQAAMMIWLLLRA